MAWGWSHSPEAYQNARNNLDLQEREWLEIVFAEWAAIAEHPDDTEHFDNAAYEAALSQARTLPADILAEHIGDKMEEQALCTNGGHQAWACPYGCVPHLVSFDDEHALSEERRLAQEQDESEAETLAWFAEDDEDEELDRGPITP